MVSTIATYLTQTIKELHFEPQMNAAILFRENLREAQVTSAVDIGLSWQIPDPTTFQAMGFVRFDSVWDDQGKPKAPPEMTPNRGMNQLREFYYRGGGEYFFSGFGGIGGVVSLAYYEFPKTLKYKTETLREASYDPESGWTYAAGIITDEQKLAARALCSNWLTQRWSEFIEEGVRAKLYKRLSDTERARTSYSMYQGFRASLISSETADLGGFQ
jgi:hypothetical protein